jgi:hypothetical protein
VTTILIRAHKDPFRVASAEQTLRRNLIGGNVGNLVFSQSVCRLLSTSDARIRTAALPGKQDPGPYDRLVLPLANAFRPGFGQTIDRLTELLERTSVPTTVLGVGAQAGLDGRPDRRLDRAVRGFVTAALRIGTGPIGVRGEFTRDYLVGLGFADDEVAIIGCPSMFMWGPDLKVTKRLRELDRDSPIALNISPYVPQIGAISRDQPAKYPNMIYFGQNLQTLELLITGHYPADPDAKVRSVGGPVDLDHPLLEQDRTRFFLDATTWIEHLKSYQFSFGTRIHGNIAALLAGVPALVLAHDARTRELAEYHQIPHRLITDRPQELDAAELYAATDWEPMTKSHPDRWAVFEEFLSQHGLRTVFAAGEDRGANFDSRLAATDFPGPVRTLKGLPLHELYAMRDELNRLRAESQQRSGPVADRLVAAGRTSLRRVRQGVDRVRNR